MSEERQEPKPSRDSEMPEDNYDSETPEDNHIESNQLRARKPSTDSASTDEPSASLAAAETPASYEEGSAENILSLLLRNTDIGESALHLMQQFNKAAQDKRLAQQEAVNAQTILDLERKRLEREAEEAESRYKLEQAKDSAVHQLKSSRNKAREIVLYGIVLFLLALPLTAVLLHGTDREIAPEDFVQFVAPLTGIAGTVLGYWFGQKDR